FWLALFVVLSMTLIVLDQLQRLNPVEDVAARAIVPVQTQLTERANPIFEFWSTIGQIGSLREDNARLRAQVSQLEIENTQLRRAEAENEAMRAELGFAQASPQFRLSPATVIGKDLHGLNDYIEIDRGSLDGLRSHMAVVSAEGFLVGRIASLNDHRARVLIITNPSSSVAAMISGSGEAAQDVVDGEIHGRLVMRNIQQGVKVKEGDDVLTSGLGGNFPKRLKIGKIASVKQSDVQLFQQADVAPYCDFGQLSFVEVITNNVPID
ncbi:MAG: rod shape-determining protein MreC, partial [Chloroflexota bacterium]|nr:rod shape-determining protein MreC [Chloroflexota bacterium]